MLVTIIVTVGCLAIVALTIAAQIDSRPHMKCRLGRHAYGPIENSGHLAMSGDAEKVMQWLDEPDYWRTCVHCGHRNILVDWR